jgi:LPXTG-motif cell wall-anchored protein
VTVSGTTDALGVLAVSIAIPENAAGPATIGVLDATSSTVISSPITIAAATVVAAAVATADLAHTGTSTTTTLMIAGLLIALGLVALTAGSKMIEPIVAKK